MDHLAVGVTSYASSPRIAGSTGSSGNRRMSASLAHSVVVTSVTVSSTSIRCDPGGDLEQGVPENIPMEIQFSPRGWSHRRGPGSYRREARLPGAGDGSTT